MNKNSAVIEIVSCEVCSNTLNGPELDFGEQPLCDDLKNNELESLSLNKYHQNIVLCEICYTAHQKFQVNKLELFKPTYHYRASLTKDVLNGMLELVNSCGKVKKLDEKSVILDIGCNDGSLLNIFKKQYNVKTIGVDPTNAIDNAVGLDLSIKEYFSNSAVEQIKEQFQKIDVITFTNVFAHIEDLKELIFNLKKLIDEETLIIVENHYLGSIIDKNQFDTFYHEHPRTYSVKSFDYISEQLDVGIIEIDFPRRYAGNIRVMMSRNKDLKLQDTIFKDEFNPHSFQEIQLFYDSWKIKTKETINSLKISNEDFNGKALPGRAVMLINSLEISSDFMPKVYEQNFSPKVGNYVPGTNIFIDKDDNISGNNLIVWSWHIVDEIITYLRNQNISATIWTPLPEFKKIVSI